jgi:hypothetical protein
VDLVGRDDDLSRHARRWRGLRPLPANVEGVEQRAEGEKVEERCAQPPHRPASRSPTIGVPQLLARQVATAPGAIELVEQREPP